MKHEDLPEFLKEAMLRIGVKERDYEGGFIELEFWLHAIANQLVQQAADAKALADTVSKWRDHVQMLGTMGMVGGLIDQATKPTHR